MLCKQPKVITMQTIQKNVPSAHTKTAATPVSAKETGKLAAFIQHHHHAKDAMASWKGVHMVELKGDDNAVAEHLGIGPHELTASYATLTSTNAIKRHGVHKVEIINSALLSDFAKHAA